MLGPLSGKMEGYVFEQRFDNVSSDISRPTSNEHKFSSHLFRESFEKTASKYLNILLKLTNSNAGWQD